MTKRQMAFGVICFLIGILVGMEIAGNLDVLFRLVIVVAILLLCVYLVLPLPTTKHTSPPGSCATRATKAYTEEAIKSSDAGLQHTSCNISSTIISRP